MSEAFGRNSFGDMFDDDEEIDEEMNEDDHEDCDQEDHDDDEDDDDENDDDENDDFRLKRFRLSEASKKRTEVIRQILEDLQKEILETTKQTHAEEAESSAAEEASGKAAESEGNPDKAASDRAALFTPQDSVECKTQALLQRRKSGRSGGGSAHSCAETVYRTERGDCFAVAAGAVDRLCSCDQDFGMDGNARVCIGNNGSVQKEIDPYYHGAVRSGLREILKMYIRRERREDGFCYRGYPPL